MSLSNRSPFIQIPDPPYPDFQAMSWTVLTLSGWSITQFSYWAHCAEAICVLMPHNKLLYQVYQVAVALDRCL